MRYCVQYYRNFRYNDIIDEVNIFYNDNIVDFLTAHPWYDNQRVIIDICEMGDKDIIPTIQMCKRQHNNLAVKLSVWQNEILVKLREAGIPYFFANFATRVDEIYGMIQRGVSDVFVTETAGFQIAEIGRYCHSKGVNVRVIPNIAQYSHGFRDEIPDLCKFFIRPEDTDLYEEYVDVFEIMAPEDKLSIIYQIYRHKVWDGDLNKLISSFNDSVFNPNIVPYFGQNRIKCNQRCMFEKCNICPQAKQLAKMFINSKIEMKLPKDKEWENERVQKQPGTDENDLRDADPTASDNDSETPQE